MRHFKTTTVLILSLVLSGCSDLKFGNAFLEKAPGVDVTIDTIFSSKFYADRALVSAYATLRCGYTVHNQAWPIGSGGAYKYENSGNKVGNDVLDALTDLINSHCNWGGAYNTYYFGQYNAEFENGSSSTKFGFTPELETAWIGIRKAFLYINNVDRVPDMTEEEKTRGKGEAYVIIATHYLDMLRHFGGIPLLKTDVSTSNDSETDYTRQSVEAVVDYIVWLCDTAAGMLPWTVSEDQDGRMTRAAAMGLKCRALLFAASPLFNSGQPYSAAQPAIRGGNIGKINDSDVPSMYWLGRYDASRWEAVVDACEAFFEENRINGNPYTLIQSSGTSSDDYCSTWNRTYADRYNGEIIIATGRQMPTFADTYHRCYFGPSSDIDGNTGRGYGGGCVTLNFVDLFPTADGHRALYRDWIAANGNEGTLNDHPFQNRDPRLYESVMILGDHFQGRQAEMWINGRERMSESDPRAATGFSSRKFIWDYNSATFHDKPANYSYLRLAEIILTYAEALNETGNREGAMEQLNLIRNRVGLPDLTEELLEEMQAGKTFPKYNDCSLIGDEALREEILDERARELFFEECRWYDMVRWEREDIFRKDLEGIQIRIIEGTTDDNDFSDLVFSFSDPVKEDPRYWATNWDPKWYLSAFPPNEINKGYGLVQNPGW